MKIFFSVLALLLTLSLNACSTTGTSDSNSDIKIVTDIDPKANFKGYNSYIWMGSATIMNDPEGRWVTPGFDANAEIKHLIDSSLRVKGMSEAASNPDVIIGYALGINMSNMQYKENPDTSFKSLKAVPKGALVIIMVDAQTGVVIWSGSAKAEIKGNTGEKVKTRLKYAVENMMNSLPR